MVFKQDGFREPASPHLDVAAEAITFPSNIKPPRRYDVVTMPGCAQSCSDCSCKSKAADQPEDIEDYFSKFLEAKERIAQLEKTIHNLGGRVSPPKDSKPSPKPLRSKGWFNDSSDPIQTSIYLERYQNFGLTLKELMSGKPIIGIAQTGSDLSPCNRHHIELAKRVREGIRTAGAIAFEFPTHPIQETGRRPTATLDRNLAYLGLVELLHGYPIDGVVLLTGCDKTTPACIMAAATMVRKYRQKLDWN